MGRCDLTDAEWDAIKPHLPNKPRGVPRVDDRRVLNGIFWVLRSGAPWADLPERYGERTTVYNRFVRWRKAGVWDRLMDAIVEAHDGEVQMIDTSPSCESISKARRPKGGSRSMSWSFPRRAYDKNPRARRQEGAADQAQTDGRSGQRRRQRPRDDRRSARRGDADRRQGL
jgi:transposase